VRRLAEGALNRRSLRLESAEIHAERPSSPGVPPKGGWGAGGWVGNYYYEIEYDSYFIMYVGMKLLITMKL
jgi:hypothetical protein